MGSRLGSQIRCTDMYWITWGWIRMTYLIIFMVAFTAVSSCEAL
jgi:hypothetical protein